MSEYTINLDDVQLLSFDTVKSFFDNNNYSVSDDFIEFYSKYNCGAGEVGECAYIEIWDLEEIVQLNAEYKVSENLPNTILFGSDGGDMAFGFDLTNKTYFTVPFIGMGFMVGPEYLGESYSELWEYLNESD